MSQEEVLPPPIWIHITGTVPDPKIPEMVYAPGTTLKTQGWPKEYLQTLWREGKAHEVEPPAWAAEETGGGA